MKTAVVAAWLLGELLKMPYSHAPGETREEYVARAGDVTTMLAEEAAPYADGRGWSITEISAGSLIIWKGESEMDRRIHAGEQHPVWTQDHMLAKCGMQLHAGGLVPQAEWEKLAGTDLDATRLCAKFGIRVFVAMARQCGVWYGQRGSREHVAAAIAAYATGGKCVPRDRDWARADRWLTVMASRPDKSPVKGFRRTAPAEIPAAVRQAADRVRDDIGKEATVGKVYAAEADGQKYALLVEKHASGKTGVSVLVKE